MSTRIWEPFLTEQDREHLEATGTSAPFGFGQRPVLLSIDNYRQVIGDEPEELLEAVKTWPGSVGMAGWNALPRIAKLLENARSAGVPLVHATGLLKEDSNIVGWSERPGQQYEPNDPEAHRRRFDIVSEAEPAPGETVIRKTAPSVFFGTPLLAHLISLGIDTLIVCGESTSGCVRATVVDGCAYRFRVVVVEDCVYDRHEASHAINLFDMNQKYADVLPLDEVLAWLKTAKTGPYTSTRSQGRPTK